MSTRMSACASANRNSASARASSVFPTPVGPEKMNEPIGRFGSLSPARLRRIAREIAAIASSWPTTRLCSSSSMRSEPRGLRLLQPGDRDAGPAGDDEGDVLFVDHRAGGSAGPSPTPPACAGSGSAARAPGRAARPRSRSPGRGSRPPSGVDLLQRCLRARRPRPAGPATASRARAPASSITSIALSGRKRSVM